MASFQDLLSGPAGPQVASAWSDVQNQIAGEGGSGLDLQAAQDTLADTFSQLTTSQLGVDPNTALAYATRFTMTAQTVAGAVQTVSGLIRAAQNASTPEEAEAVVNSVVGTMISVAIATGVIASGIGALIVSFVSVTFTVLEAAGLLGSAPVAKQCGIGLSFTPSIAVGCAGSQTAVANQPNAPAWRAFPESSSPWYTKAASIGSSIGVSFAVPHFTWYGNDWYALLPAQVFGGASYRPIDSACADLALLEASLVKQLPLAGVEASAPNLTLLQNFRQAYLIAWKGNQAFAFNGLTPQPDWIVLVQTARIWNRAHASTSTFDVGPGDLFDASYGAVTDLTHVGGADPIVGGKLRLNVGAPAAPRVLPNTTAILSGQPVTTDGVTIPGTPNAPPGSTSPAAADSGPSAGAVVGVTAGLALVGTALWAGLTGRLTPILAKLGL